MLDEWAERGEPKEGQEIVEGHTYLLRFTPLKHLDVHKTLMTESQQRQARLCREVPQGACAQRQADAGKRLRRQVDAREEGSR